MKKRSLLAAAGLALAACTPVQASNEELCLDMTAGDTRIHERMKDDRVDRYGYCACFGAHVDLLEAGRRERIEKVIRTIIDIRAEQSVSVLDAAVLIFADEDQSTYGIAVDEIESTGKLLDNLQRDMSVMSGACPTPGSIDF